MWRDVTTTKSYLSQVEPEITFGLGEATVVDRLVVHWPSGEVTELEQVAANEQLELTEPE